MSKVLIIPDTHLKSDIFDMADSIMNNNPDIDYAVQLGDNLDDFYSFEPDYARHNARMVWFNLMHPNTVWLLGNHEVSYLIDRPVTGNISCGKKYAELYVENFSPKIVHQDDKVVFSHAGVLCGFSTLTINEINNTPFDKLWGNESPLWIRWQGWCAFSVYPPYDELIQVTGHTPTPDISQEGNFISTDVFSTDWGKKIGVEQLIIIDTSTGKWEKVDVDFRKEFLSKEDQV